MVHGSLVKGYSVASMVHVRYSWSMEDIHGLWRIFMVHECLVKGCSLCSMVHAAISWSMEGISWSIRGIPSDASWPMRGTGEHFKTDLHSNNYIQLRSGGDALAMPYTWLHVLYTSVSILTAEFPEPSSSKLTVWPVRPSPPRERET
jgi:hypothetical protein